MNVLEQALEALECELRGYMDELMAPKKTVEAIAALKEAINRSGDEYAEMFHPEFGTEWRAPDGECYKAYQLGLVQSSLKQQNETI